MANYWAGLTQRRLNRQRFLVGAGLTVAGSTTALVLGCSSSNNNNAKPKAAASATTVATSASGGASATAAATKASAGSPTTSAATTQAAASASGTAAQVKLGGTLKSPDIPPDVFDPAITVHTASWLQGVTTCLTGLLASDEQLRTVAHMAELPEQPDPLTYVFKLKPGIKWHNLPPANGRAFTADDAVFGLKRFTQDNPEFFYGASLTPIDKYEVVDPQTFKLTVKAPYAPLLSAIGDEWCMMVNREMVEKVGDAGIKKYENLLGTGPWVRGELKPNVSSYLVKNPDYFIKGRPYLDRLEFTVVPDLTARGAGFRAKQFDTTVIWGYVTKQEADQLKSELGDKVVSQTKRWTAHAMIAFNCAQDPFQDPRVRRAFHLAIDRQATEAAVGKGNLAFMAAIPQSLPLYAIPEAELLTLPGYRQPKDQDIADAKKLLAAAGVTGTLKVVAKGSGTDPNAVAAQAALKKIDVALEIQPTSDPLADRNRSNFVMIFSAQPGGPDPDPILYRRFHSESAANYTKYKSDAFDKLADQQRQELDTKKRQQIVRDAQNLLLEDAPMPFLYSQVYYPTSYSYVKGWRMTPGFNQGWMLAEAWLDK